MALALLLVGLTTACLGALFAATLPGSIAWLTSLPRWRRTRGAALKKLTGAEGAEVSIEGTLRAGEEGAKVLLATAVPEEDMADVPGTRALHAAAPAVWLDLADG